MRKWSSLLAMQDYEIERSAVRLCQKYGKKALPKAVEVVKFYLGEGDSDSAKRWVSIGYAVKKLQNIKNIEEVVESVKEAEEEMA